MSINKSNKEYKPYVGGTEISKGYLGNTPVFQKGEAQLKVYKEVTSRYIEWDAVNMVGSCLHSSLNNIYAYNINDYRGKEISMSYTHYGEGKNTIMLSWVIGNGYICGDYSEGSTLEIPGKSSGYVSGSTSTEITREGVSLILDDDNTKGYSYLYVTAKKDTTPTVKVIG